MAAQRFSPWNVNNPRTDHTARLREGQSLRITLDPPDAYGFPNDCVYVVQSNSSFLKLESEQAITTKQGVGGEYLFSQTNVPSEWSHLSMLFLGNIRVIARQYGPHNANEAEPIDTVLGTVCAYLNCGNAMKEDVITLISPDKCSFSPTVKLEPSQVLEVVVADDGALPLEWRHYPFAANRERTALCLHKVNEEVLSKGMGSGGGSTNNLFYCERRILPHGNGTMPIFAERHFFFDMMQLTSDTLQGMPNDNYDACDLHLIAWNHQGQVIKEATVHTILALRSKIRKRENKRQLSKRKFKEDIVARSLVESERLLRNPNRSEKVFIYGEADQMIVELTQPSVLWSQASLCSEARWQCRIGGLLLHDRNRHRSVKAQEIAPCQVNGVTIQRFVIGAEIPKGKEKVDELILGEVVFHCPAIVKLVRDHERKLNLILKRSSLSAKSHMPSSRSVTLAGDTYNIRTSTSVYNSPPRSHGQGKKHQAKGKKRAYASADHWLVSIHDGDGDLGDGEQVELHSLSLPNSKPSPQLLLKYHGPENASAMGSHGDPNVPVLVHDQFHHDEKAKKKGTDLLADYERKRKEKKGCVDKRREKSNIALNASGSVERSDMSMQGGKSPLMLYSVQDGDEITLQTGQPLILRLPMPDSGIGKSNVRSQWCVNTVQMDNDLKIWTESNDIVLVDNEFVHQEFEIRILTVRTNCKLFGDMRAAKPGVHRAGALQISCQRGPEKIVRKVYLNLEVTKSAHTPLKWWLDWHKLRKAARPINFDLPDQPPFSYKEGRVTLINPKGRPDIELKSGDEIEVILGSPFKPYEPQLAGWSLKAAVLPHSHGSLEVVEQRYHTLVNGQLIFRGLYRVTIHDGPFFGEIKLVWNGEETGDWVIFTRDEDSRRKSVGRQEDKKPSLAIAYGELSNPRKIMVQDWEHEQRAVIFPTDHVHIQLPRLDEFIDPKCRRKASPSAWGVEFEPYYLEDDVMAALHPHVSDVIEQLNPWHEGMILPSDTPWRDEWYVLPPFEDVGDYVEDVLAAFRKVYGERESYPFAELIFSYNYGKKFVVSRTLYLELGNVAAMVSDQNRNGVQNVLNPPDHGNAKFNADQVLHITLQHKWEKEKKGNQRARLYWHLVKVPVWLQSVGCDSQDNQDTFKFAGSIPQKGVKSCEVSGTVEFQLSDKKSRKRIRLTCMDSRKKHLQASIQ